MIHINGKKHDLGGGFFVTRILPDRAKRMVGPFTFLDHMGPVTIAPGQNTDVRQHPHIGLSTLTYLFDGRMVHRDSLGYTAQITPGEVNWMVAGKGISHSERAHDSDNNIERKLHGLQFWIALPEGAEDCDPSFRHYDQSLIPKMEYADHSINLIAGSAFGLSSPVKTTSPLVFAEIKAKQNFNLDLTISGFELGIYIIQGSVSNGLQKISANEMLVVETNQPLKVQVETDTHFVIIGGEPLGNRFMWWNLVSSSKEKIEQAKKDWSEGRFPRVPGETEFIPLPS